MHFAFKCKYSGQMSKTAFCKARFLMSNYFAVKGNTMSTVLFLLQIAKTCGNWSFECWLWFKTVFILVRWDYLKKLATIIVFFSFKIENDSVKI